MRPRAEQPVVELIVRDLAFGPATIHDLEETTGMLPRPKALYSRRGKAK